MTGGVATFYVALRSGKLHLTLYLQHKTHLLEVGHQLGFDFKWAVFGSIDLVYEKEIDIASETIIRLPEITFANPPKKNAA